MRSTNLLTYLLTYLQLVRCVMSVLAGSVNLPPDVVHSNDTSSSYRHVYETWESDTEAADAVAMTMSRDSADVVDKDTVTVHESFTHKEVGNSSVTNWFIS